MAEQAAIREEQAAAVARAGEAATDKKGTFHAIVHHRQFRYLWTAGVVTQFGQWFQNIAIGWLALTLTNSPSFVGQVAFASGLPILLLSFPAGALLDRIDRRRALLATHSLTLARHPSETEERLMVRLFAFALFADERLEFGRGLSSDDEADLWQVSRSGEIERWIDVGLPDERVLRKACGRSREVVLVAYGGRAVSIWFEANRSALERLSNLTVLELPVEVSAAMAAVCDRNMTLAATVQEGHMFLGDVAVEWKVLMGNGVSA